MRQGQVVQRAGIYNPMVDVCWEIDLRDWKGDDELLQFIRDKGRAPID